MLRIALALGLLVGTASRLAGCASPYRKPCRILIDFTMDRQDAVDAHCQKLVTRLDDGTAPDWRTRFRGCVKLSTGEVTVVEGEDTWSHEIRHLLDYYCRKESK